MSRQQLKRYFFYGIISLGYMSSRSTKVFAESVKYKNLQTSFNMVISVIAKILKNLKKNKDEAKEHKF